LFVLSSPFFTILLGLLALRGFPVFDYESCTHKDFRWFVPEDQHNYRTIRIIRFRTRNPDSTFALFGRFLEASHIYRWPELINVIRGDLALVGVKPLNEERMPDLDEDWKKTRFTVPMGLTGLWYLRTNENSSLNEILISDAYYAATRNWKEDMTILLQTPLAWVKHFRRSGKFPGQKKEANLWN
jgi:lipopolysaccharide/colanic/teichoic acid biosynthesis glycosyltransferase